MIAFMAEQGGFMEYKTSQVTRRAATKHPVASRGASHPRVGTAAGVMSFFGKTSMEIALSQCLDQWMSPAKPR